LNTTTKLLASSLLLLSPVLVHAAGLGKLSVLSSLGQPLKVEIDVVALQKGELASLNARVAAPEVFRRAGVEYGSVIPHLRAAIEPRNGGAVITLRSEQPVDEPFVDVLVELDSASGNLVRQYTFLLDPVGYAGPTPIVAAPVTVAQPAPAEPAPAAKPIEGESSRAPVAAAQAAPAAAEQPATATAPSQASSDQTPSQPATHEVKAGDTLSKIAMAYKPADVSLQQMLVALQRANEDAFIAKNMNLVREGKILRIPDAESVQRIDQNEAVRVVNTHTREFAEYRARIAAEVAAAEATGSASQQQASGRITTQVQEPPAPAEAPQDELRLSKSAEGGGTTAGLASGDDAAATANALREANERVTQLERNLSDLQKLLELKNEQLAQLQQQAQTASVPADAPAETPAEPVAEAPAAPVTETEASTPAPAEAPSAEPVAETPAVEPAAAEATQPTADAATAIAKPEPEPEAEKPKRAKKKPVAQPAAMPEPSFLDTILDDPLLPAGALGAALALLLGLMIYRRRRAATLDNSLIGMTTTDSSSVFGTTGGRNIDTGASSLQTDFSQSAIGSIDTEEVDPVAEADVYMAYGRDAQAEEILKEALQKDPSRLAVRLKLLEIYAARKDLKAFETTATEIYAATGGQGADWEKVVTLGRSIDPNNSLYGAQQAAEAPPAAEPAAAAFAAPAPEAAPAEPTAAAPAATTPEEAAPPMPMLDLDLNTDSAAAPAAPAVPDLPVEPSVSQALDLDLDLNLGDTPAGPKTEEPMDFSPSGTFIMDAETKKAVSDLSESQSLDIDLGAPTLEPKDARKPDLDAGLDFKLDEPAAETPKAEVPAVDLSGLSLDLDAGDAGDATYQEVATKLDLAKAYEEMGDKDGARELLNEVLKEGDAAQQEQARSMLETIG